MLKRQYGFLYWKKGEEKRKDNVEIFVMTRHVFGARDSPCMALKALEKMIKRLDLEKQEKQEMKKSLYMDDLLIASNNKDKVDVKGKRRVRTLT